MSLPYVYQHFRRCHLPKDNPCRVRNEKRVGIGRKKREWSAEEGNLTWKGKRERKGERERERERGGRALCVSSLFSPSQFTLGSHDTDHYCLREHCQ